MAPGALPLFEQANHARDLGDHATAERLYGRLFAEVPSFVHAESERCSELSRLARQNEALPLCRDALAKDPSAANLATLASVLALSDDGAEPTPAELAEADTLLKRALQLEPNDAFVVGVQCLLAHQRESLEQPSACAARLRALAPNGVWTVYWSWVDALNLGQWSEAERLVARAQELALPPEMVEHMQRATADARPWTVHAFRCFGLVLGSWAALCAVLLLIGVALSKVTLRTVESWTHEPPKHSAALRAIYGSVLHACAALYYASLLIVMGGVLAAVAALIEDVPTRSWPEIMLASLAVLAALAICGVILKSVFFRSSEAAPGIRLDLAKQPMLQAALAEVAAQIGTRVVDTVYLSPDTKLAVFERQGRERCLVIGIALLEGMPLGGFKALLAHEYGHFSERDTVGGGFALSVRRSLSTLVDSLDRSSGYGVLWNPALLLAPYIGVTFLLVSQGASRLQEVLADRHAAEAYGSVAFVTGLKHAFASALAFEQPLAAEIRRALAAKSPLSELWSPAASGDAGAAKSSEMLGLAPSAYDSHPAPGDRIRWVEALHYLPQVACEHADAWSLFSDRAGQELELTLFFCQELEKKGLRPAAIAE